MKEILKYLSAKNFFTDYAKSVKKFLADNGLEVVEWFDKKEIEPKLPSSYSFLTSLKHD